MFPIQYFSEIKHIMTSLKICGAFTEKMFFTLLYHMLPQYIFISIKILLMIIILFDSVFLTPYNTYILFL